jgi:hypothetical protein
MHRSGRKHYAGALIGIGLMGIAGAMYAGLSFVLDGLPLNDYARLVFSFACLGLLIGVVEEFDAESGRHVRSRPFLRCAAGAICGAAVAVIWHSPAEAILLAAIAGAILGLLGKMWSKWMQF